MVIKKLYKKRAKLNSKKLINSIQILGENSLPYEPISKINAEKNINKKIYINKSNLGRVIKLMKIIKNGYYEDETNDIKEIKNYNKNYKFYFKNVRNNCIPKIAKTNNFSKSTIIKYNQLQGNYFGMPV